MENLDLFYEISCVNLCPMALEAVEIKTVLEKSTIWVSVFVKFGQYVCFADYSIEIFEHP